MNSYYVNMSLNRLRDTLDQLEERLDDMESDEPENTDGRRKLEDLINNLCELVLKKESCCA